MDAAADKFSSAEDALFGGRARAVAAEAPVAAAPLASSPVGRILRDLHEPAPPPPPELPAPARRGRKPGSKNKPKPVLVTAPEASAPPPKVRPLWADALADQAIDEAATIEPAAPSALPPRRDLPVSPAGDGPPQTRRPRLRDRSSILKRYVLGTEPAPGQPGWVRGLRAKRRG